MAQLIQAQKSIDLGLITFGTGSWATTYSSGSYYALHSTAANTSTVDIPISIEVTNEGPGVEIASIDVPYFCGTADLSAAPTAALYKTEINSLYPFVANAVYLPVAGDYYIPSTPNGYMYQVTTAGKAGAEPSSYPTVAGQTVTTGDATFTCVALANSTVNTIAVTAPNAIVTHSSTDQMFSVNVTSPAFDNVPGEYVLHLTLAAAATSVVKLYPPIVNYTKEI
jgi:hypothetical protein